METKVKSFDNFASFILECLVKPLTWHFFLQSAASQVCCWFIPFCLAGKGYKWLEQFEVGNSLVYKEKVVHAPLQHLETVERKKGVARLRKEDWTEQHLFVLFVKVKAEQSNKYLTL